MGSAGTAQRTTGDHTSTFGDVEPTIAFERTETGDAVPIGYHVSDVPGAGPTTQHPPKLVDGTASGAERETFAAAWHGRVQRVLADDSLFSVDQTRSSR